MLLALGNRTERKEGQEEKKSIVGEDGDETIGIIQRDLNPKPYTLYPIPYALEPFGLSQGLHDGILTITCA